MSPCSRADWERGWLVLAAVSRDSTSRSRHCHHVPCVRGSASTLATRNIRASLMRCVWAWALCPAIIISSTSVGMQAGRKPQTLTGSSDQVSRWIDVSCLVYEWLGRTDVWVRNFVEHQGGAVIMLARHGTTPRTWLLLEREAGEGGGRHGHHGCCWNGNQGRTPWKAWMLLERQGKAKTR